MGIVGGQSDMKSVIEFCCFGGVCPVEQSCVGAGLF